MGVGWSYYSGIRTTEGNIRGTANTQKTSSLFSKVKLLKVAMLHVLVYDDDDDDNNNNFLKKRKQAR